jgi:hypothetical protein
MYHNNIFGGYVANFETKKKKSPSFLSPSPAGIYAGQYRKRNDDGRIFFIIGKKGIGKWYIVYDGPGTMLVMSTSEIRGCSQVFHR